MEGILTDKGILRTLRGFSKKKRHFVDIDYSDSLIQESRTAPAILILRARSILTCS
jgi:hypothetical protein